MPMTPKLRKMISVLGPRACVCLLMNDKRVTEVVGVLKTDKELPYVLRDREYDDLWFKVVEPEGIADQVREFQAQYRLENTTQVRKDAYRLIAKLAGKSEPHADRKAKREPIIEYKEDWELVKRQGELD